MKISAELAVCDSRRCAWHMQLKCARWRADGNARESTFSLTELCLVPFFRPWDHRNNEPNVLEWNAEHLVQNLLLLARSKRPKITGGTVYVYIGEIVSCPLSLPAPIFSPSPMPALRSACQLSALSLSTLSILPIQAVSDCCRSFSTKQPLIVGLFCRK